MDKRLVYIVIGVILATVVVLAGLVYKSVAAKKPPAPPAKTIGESVIPVKQAFDSRMQVLDNAKSMAKEEKERQQYLEELTKDPHAAGR